MKLAIVLMTVFCLDASSHGFSQKITINRTSIQLEQVFKEIRRQTGYQIFYNDKFLQRTTRIDVHLTNVSIQDALDSCFKNQPISYSIIDNVIVLRRKEQQGENIELPQPPPNIELQGHVADSTGRPVQGASVILKGENIGSVTDANGYFRLNVPNRKDIILVISHIGYKTEERRVGKELVIDVTLSLDVNVVNDLVVVGYQTIHRSQFAGSISTVSGDVLNERTSPDVTSLLQGNLPGLSVTVASGQPGNQSNALQIRGLTTFSNAGVSPLIIVDGLPGNIYSINQNDIEAVTILKDAAATAIYGSRGANGVIVVTTKKGKPGQLRFNYGYSLGVVNTERLPKVVTNSVDYMNLYNEAAINSGIPAFWPDSTIEAYKSASSNSTEYPNNNWLKDIFKTAYVQNHNLSVSGGTDKTVYSASFGIVDQPGTMLGWNYKKYLFGLSLQSTVNQRISFGADLQMRYDILNSPPQGAGDEFLSTLAQSPLYTPVLDGKFIAHAYSNAEPGNKNYVAVVNSGENSIQKNFYTQGNIHLGVKIIDGLQWETRTGIAYTSGNYNSYSPADVPEYFYHNVDSLAGYLDVGTPGLTEKTSDEGYVTGYTQLNFNRKYGKHQIAALAGFQEEYDKYEQLTGFRTGFPTNLLTQLNAGSPTGQTTGGYATEWALRSYYGSVNYVYNDKYSVSGSFRRDGSSRFSPDNRYGDFYSVSAYWMISNESFMRNLTFIDNLKIRGSYGSVGNQNITNPNTGEPYPYQPTLSSAYYVFGTTLNPGFAVTQLVDQNISWETTNTGGGGLDLLALKRRLGFSFDYSEKYTKNILRQAQVGDWVGQGAPTINDGQLKSWGWETSASWHDKIGKDWGYTISATAQHYKNKLVQFGATQINGNNIDQTGHEYNEWYLYAFDGIFQSQDEVNNSPNQNAIAPGAAPGTIKIKDVNGDGAITTADRTYVPGLYPKLEYSSSLGFNWKNFDIVAQFYGSYGKKILVSGWGINPFQQGSTPTVDWLSQGWTPQNHSNTHPMITLYGDVPAVANWVGSSTYSLESASFFRMRGAQLGYSLKSRSIKKAIGADQIRFYVQGENLFTISAYPGLDPERADNGGSYVTYPQNRTVTFGANIQF